MSTSKDSGFPPPNHPIPAAIRRLSGNEPVATVWVNGEGGVTCRIGARPDQVGRTDAAAERALATAPPIDRLVVCHGDACSPNTLIDDNGEYAGHVDLGSLGLADRWADLAIGSWSTEWNYGPGWQEAYVEAYGLDVDHDRLRYYRELWDLT